MTTATQKRTSRRKAGPEPEQATLEEQVSRVVNATPGPVSPDELLKTLQGTNSGITFAELRRALWSLIRQGAVEFTPEWKLTGNSSSALGK